MIRDHFVRSVGDSLLLGTWYLKRQKVFMRLKSDLLCGVFFAKNASTPLDPASQWKAGLKQPDISGFICICVV